MKKFAGLLVMLLSAAHGQAAPNARPLTNPYPQVPLPPLIADEDDCLRQATTLGKQNDPEFVRVSFDRPIDAERYDAPVGSQRVSTVYKGSAVYQTLPGSERLQFICLHSGQPGGAVFFDYLPVSLEVPDITRYNQYETWQCRQQGTFPVTYNSVYDQIFLRYDGRDQALRHANSASGARYDNAELVWWGQGREATLSRRDPAGAETGERVLDTCQRQDGEPLSGSR